MTEAGVEQVEHRVFGAAEKGRVVEETLQLMGLPAGKAQTPVPACFPAAGKETQ